MNGNAMEEYQPEFFEHSAETIRKYPFIALLSGDDFWEAMSGAFEGKVAVPVLAPEDAARAGREAGGTADTFTAYAAVFREMPDLAKHMHAPGYWDLLEAGRELLNGDVRADIELDLYGGLAEADPGEWAEWVADAEWIEDEHGGAVEVTFEDDDPDEDDGVE